MINAEWDQISQSDFDLEWAVLRKDLMWKLLPEELDRYYHIDFDAFQQGRRVLFVPIFYAFGQVPNEFLILDGIMLFVIGAWRSPV